MSGEKVVGAYSNRCELLPQLGLLLWYFNGRRPGGRAGE